MGWKVVIGKKETSAAAKPVPCDLFWHDWSIAPEKLASMPAYAKVNHFP
jgi:hypothetical protein